MMLQPGEWTVVSNVLIEALAKYNADNVAAETQEAAQAARL
jgi:hypothetical protein